MVGPSARRAAANSLRQNHGYSTRRACSLVDTPRSGLYYQPRQATDEEALRSQIRDLARRNPRFGCPRIQACLEREGLKVNHKRVHRIWKDEGLSLERKRPRRRQYGPRLEVVNKALGPNHVWSYDFLEDRTARGGRLRCLTILDEYTRESLAIEVARSIGSEKVLEVLGRLVDERGVPEFIRSDNGPEFVAKAVQDWLEKKKCGALFITPGSPWENPYIESFNGKFRDECLNREIFLNGREAQIIIEQWRQDYNTLRPHSSLGYLTPKEYAEQVAGFSRATPSCRRQPAETRTMMEILS